MITYQVSRDEKDPLKFLLFETWEGRDALGAHLQTEEFQEFINAGVVEGGLQMSVFRALEPLE
ncbi:hypothetical protein BJY04DRAFT_178588 [Aspergillus karnatakaensis]|uniref:putative quinol monooxygenase n=1 Tax=Aspergillus karnatakaensis TaxID=1810916 RepID=UPI003CCD3A1D